MAPDVSDLDQQYVESLKQRNELIRQLNLSLQVQISEAKSRAVSVTVGATDVPTRVLAISPASPTTVLPPSPLKNAEVTNGASTQNPPDKPTGPSESKVPEQKDTSEAVPKKRFRVVVNRWNPASQKWEDSEYKSAQDEDENSRQITYRRIMDVDNERKVWSEECVIPLPGLKNLLRRTMTHVDHEWFESDTISFHSPFNEIVYNWNALEKEIEPQQDDTDELRNSRNDLKFLLDNVRISEPRKVKKYFEERDSHLRAKSVTFGTLWTLFQPGSKVLAKPFMDEWQMFEVQANWYYSASQNDRRIIDDNSGFDQYSHFHLFGAGFDWDGRHFRRYTYEFKFEKFEGRKPISGLKCFPEEYWPHENSAVDLAKLKSNLKDRGKMFVKLCTAKRQDYRCMYSGYLLYGLPPRTFRDEVRTLRRAIKRQSVIVDNSSFMESRRNPVKHFSCPPLGSGTWVDSVECCPCQSCLSGPIQSWSGHDSKSREDEREEFVKDSERLLLCPPKVLGYVPMERIWAQFSVAQLEHISAEQKEKDKLTFNKTLQLDPDHKEMLLALIKNHQAPKNRLTGDYPSNFVQDPIVGKGRGLAILLHGPPGVGKTLTAEAVALAAGKPLVPVSVAELGNAPHEAEDNLLDVFEDASRWDAVMVIDEADVFLEERVGTTDANRNALVSVLLRVLEYYDGIIILTTNRITSLDVAVQSRMHLAIQYKDFDETQKKTMFMKFLEHIPSDQIDGRDKIDFEVGRLCKRSDLNGRQIRNIVSGAQALAKSQDKKLSYDHIYKIYEATSDFVQSLKDLTLQKRGRNEAPR
ncbi:P-loop containing nucleoside triphosphate hydrolase protein [Corynespora cassiicola Philippines]|uniref:P-loop containing nucleoside triphosphate hydrolase protein n=1 Tax=Corynespora cassiicola Philippines TaxID=1448308 RepID=A0A2T2NY25_CORCC|nr:P-loop containing nucleoside triphosphate hydrolase protein [Corynespora cassiicola Philippines]